MRACVCVYVRVCVCVFALMAFSNENGYSNSNFLVHSTTTELFELLADGENSAVHRLLNLQDLLVESALLEAELGLKRRSLDHGVELAACDNTVLIAVLSARSCHKEENPNHETCPRGVRLLLF